MAFSLVPVMISLGTVAYDEISDGLVHETPLKFIDAFQKKNAIDPEIGVPLATHFTL